jgi:hypothetical protein
VNGPEVRSEVFRSTGEGLEFGAVYKPENKPIRLGFAYRTAIRTEAEYSDDLLPDENGDLVITDSTGAPIYLPKAVAFPWDVNFGFAVQVGGRPFNPPWRTNDALIERKKLERRIRELDRDEKLQRDLASAPSRAEREALQERYDRQERAEERAIERQLLEKKRLIEQQLTQMNRFYVQFAASMLVSGPVDEAVGVESLVAQTVNRSGQKTVISPRVGIESGVIPEWLKLRAGSYIEPTRFQESSPRVHVTAGLDVKLLVWNVFGLWPDDYMWRLGLGSDSARDYYTWGLTIAGWYPRHTKASDVPNFAQPTGPEN